jgi:hypothetical protein
VQENLRSWRARMRFKKAIIATVATTRCVPYVFLVCSFECWQLSLLPGIKLSKVLHTDF